MNMKSNREAFSMTEVLVAMVVLASSAVLVSSTTSSSGNLIDTGRRNSEAANLSTKELEWYASYPSLSSLPSKFQISSMPPVGTLNSASIGDNLAVPYSSPKGTKLVDPASSYPGSPTAAPISTAHQNFLNDKELGIYGAKISDDVFKIQCDIYEQRTSGSSQPGNLIYSNSLIIGRRDPRTSGQ